MFLALDQSLQRSHNVKAYNTINYSVIIVCVESRAFMKLCFYFLNRLLSYFYGYRWIVEKRKALFLAFATNLNSLLNIYMKHIKCFLFMNMSSFKISLYKQAEARYFILLVLCLFDFTWWRWWKHSIDHWIFFIYKLTKDKEIPNGSLEKGSIHYEKTETKNLKCFSCNCWFMLGRPWIERPESTLTTLFTSRKNSGLWRTFQS